jgi:hypothetical protein
MFYTASLLMLGIKIDACPVDLTKLVQINRPGVFYDNVLKFVVLTFSNANKVLTVDPKNLEKVLVNLHNFLDF